MNTCVSSYDHSHHRTFRHQLVCKSKRTFLETRHSANAATATAAAAATATAATTAATATVVNMTSGTIFQSIRLSISTISGDAFENMDVCMLYLDCAYHGIILKIKCVKAIIVMLKVCLRISD